ncbi:MAG: protoheme IX farnesyltransferase [Candidatus Puniceispirillum sp.]|nr:protoheme IX farnesyltransferase [Candidatus Puniceispirillum sp.]
MSLPITPAYANEASFSQDSSLATPRDFWLLMKPGVLSLVVFTAFVGAILAPSTIHPFVLLVAILSITLGAGGAAAFNMWYDRDIDLVMKRTRSRPIPAGRVAPHDALTFASLLSVTSVTLMGLATNMLAAGLLALSIIYYTLFYTVFLKRRTPQNIVIGGGAGAFPPLIGWVAVTNEIALLPLVLVWLIFIWTPSHFWALALYRSSDYASVRVPMLPVTHGELSTKRHIMVYSILLVASAIIPFYLGDFGAIYMVSATLLGMAYLALATKVWWVGGEKHAIRLFLFSIAYLFLLFLSMVIDHVGARFL